MLMRFRFVLLTSLMLAAGLASAEPIQIVAVGTSATNCKGVAGDKSFPVVLESLLKANSIDATVKNAGIDGDKPFFMFDRMKNREVNSKTQLVIFESGPNDRNVSAAVEYTEKSLAWLQEKHIPTIYVAFRIIQTEDQARATAEKFGATYYGWWGKDVPKADGNYQGDGHMSAKGCELWARSMLPLVSDLIAKSNIKPN